MFEIYESQILKIKEIDTGKQIAIIKEHYDMVYKTILSYDSINQKVIAKVQKFNISTSQHELDATYQDMVIFDYEGQQLEASSINGIAEIDFIVEVGTGEHTVKTVNLLWNNGEVVINA